MKLTKQAIIFLILSLVMLFSSVFAWFNLSKVSDISGIDSNIANFSNLVTFWVKRSNDEDYIEIETIHDMHSVFGDTKPGESYEFKLEIKNRTGSTRSFLVELKNILTVYFSEETKDYDLRDVFYILDGLVNISIYDFEEEPNLIEERDSITVQTISEDVVFKHDQELNKYRLNNLIVSNNNVMVSNYIDVLDETKAIVTFTLVYDPTTKNILYQENMLQFDGIYIYGQ